MQEQFLGRWEGEGPGMKAQRLATGGSRVNPTTVMDGQTKMYKRGDGMMTSYHDLPLHQPTSNIHQFPLSWSPHVYLLL